jgi:hypothetical protein
MENILVQDMISYALFTLDAYSQQVSFSYLAVPPSYEK